MLTAEHSPELFALLTSALPVLLSFLLFDDLIEELFHCHVSFGSLKSTAIKRGQLKCHVFLSTFVIKPHRHIRLVNVDETKGFARAWSGVGESDMWRLTGVSFDSYRLSAV